MKKQWLSIVLVLCMVLCLTPTTARAAESKTGTLKITVDISGVYEGDNVGDKTFSFEIRRKYATYGHYGYVDITIKSGETAGTVEVPVEEGKYIVKQTSHATIDGYDWENASHELGSETESGEKEVFKNRITSFTVHNFYKLAVQRRSRSCRSRSTDMRWVQRWATSRLQQTRCALLSIRLPSRSAMQAAAGRLWHLTPRFRQILSMR